MKRIPVEYAVLAIAVAATVAVVAPARAQAPSKAAESTAEKIARGKYIVTTSGCNDCHTPWVMGPKGPEPDMTRMLSGHSESEVLPQAPAAQGPWIMTASATNTAWAGPWGVSFAMNLTPDKETGLGDWTEEQFVQAMRTGKHQGKGRAILPPMPYQILGQLVPEELKAIFAYLQSLAPLKNHVPQPVDPPESQR